MKLLYFAWLRERLDDGDGRNNAALDDLLGRTRYHALDLQDADAIAAELSQYGDRPAVSYLSTPPNLFAPACRGLKAAGLLEEPSRLVLEKPLGHDLASAREINATLRESLDESRIFRIDHYLGKAPVQNLLALRFGNTLLEAVWDNRCIESVDILVAETAGVDGREGYYADYGALRDMVQNHMLQLLALIAMEPPAALDADSIRDEKRKVLRALRPMTAADAATDSIRGRYTAGVVEGSAAKGFLADSAVETFVGLRAWIDNWRWAGVPFYLRTAPEGVWALAFLTLAFAIGTIAEKPVVKNGQIQVGHTMKVTLACDHRTVDGATGSKFLETLKTYLENPVTMRITSQPKQI